MVKRILYHVVFWLLYLSSQVYIEYTWNLRFYPKESQWMVLYISTLAEVTMLSVRLPMVYFSFVIADRFFSGRKKYWKGVVYSLLLFIASILFFRIVIVTVEIPHVYKIKQPETFFNPERLVTALLDLLLLYALANAIRLFKSTLAMKDRENQLIQQKAEAELRHLKSQLNPHFLFNTLNSIYSLALQDSKKTAPVVHRLSELLRFTLYESSRSYVKIAEEVKVIEDYIELEKIRYGDRLVIRFSLLFDDPEVYITPLLLLPLVENAFKHGAGNSRNNAYIYIDISCREKVFRFSICNSVEECAGLDAKPKGIGLVNIGKQLELLYPGSNLEIKQEKNEFSVNLEIRLK